LPAAFILPLMNRRSFLQATVAGAASLAFSHNAFAAADNPDFTAIQKGNREAPRRIGRAPAAVDAPAVDCRRAAGAWTKVATSPCACLRDAGFGGVTKIPTDGQPGIFATLDAGAPRTIGIYFMYDVKQVDPAEWSSPPFEAAIVEKPGLGKSRGRPRSREPKGSRGSFLAALHAIRGAGRKIPVNLVFVAEGEEEIGSPHFRRSCTVPSVGCAAQVQRSLHASAEQDLDGKVTMTLGAKGIVELELVSSGEKWGRGPRKDVHSSLKAMIDSRRGIWWRRSRLWSRPMATLRRLRALPTRPVRSLPRKRNDRGSCPPLDESVARSSTASSMDNDVNYQEALELLQSRPTVNIEGLVGGYTGPGGKTILPHRAVAKLDLRLVPDMKADEALAALKAHLAKHGFADIEVNMTGGYDLQQHLG